MSRRKNESKGASEGHGRDGDIPRRVGDRALWEKHLLGRMKQSAGHLTFREIGDLTGVHPETVRRYMTHGRPTAFFVASVCKVLGLPLDWLMFGLSGAGDRAAAGSQPNAGGGPRLPDGAKGESVSEIKGPPLPEVFTLTERVSRGSTRASASTRSR